ncbi:hypothetical protein A4R26_06850 [Niastella populi]|uniref:Uncharacterized protein n=2 Tax=Niastella populi TaxID=550983 RepID=A0A1V9F5J1_9BACT|nr:hypothetical protein A4R26_06850 [Niastella populi]
MINQLKTRQRLYDQKKYIIIVSNTEQPVDPIPFNMKLLIYAMALMALTGSSCKSKTETKTAPPVIEKPAPQNPSTLPSGNHQEPRKAHRHKKIPPGHAKKIHGEQSARNYAPGHSH